MIGKPDSVASRISGILIVDDSVETDANNSDNNKNNNKSRKNSSNSTSNARAATIVFGTGNADSGQQEKKKTKQFAFTYPNPSSNNNNNNSNIGKGNNAVGSTALSPPSTNNNIDGEKSEWRQSSTVPGLASVKKTKKKALWVPGNRMR